MSMFFDILTLVGFGFSLAVIGFGVANYAEYFSTKMANYLMSDTLPKGRRRA